jgi:hypothetical protein
MELTSQQTDLLVSTLLDALETKNDYLEMDEAYENTLTHMIDKIREENRNLKEELSELKKAMRSLKKAAPVVAKRNPGRPKKVVK